MEYFGKSDQLGSNCFKIIVSKFSHTEIFKWVQEGERKTMRVGNLYNINSTDQEFYAQNFREWDLSVPFLVFMTLSLKLKISYSNSKLKKPKHP